VSTVTAGVGKGASGPSRYRISAALVLGVLGVSSASIWIRALGNERMSLLAIAADRMWLAAALLVGLRAAARGRSEVRRPQKTPRTPALLLLAGALLAVHFGAWTLSLGDLPIARSVLLVNAHPLFTALLAALLLREPIGWRRLAGIALALGGLLALSGAALSSGFGGPAGRGDLLALTGAVALSGYLLVGRVLRSSLPVLSYAVPCYATCALLLSIAAIGSGVSLRPPSMPALGLLLLLALFPTLCGHTVFNWALGHVRATTVSVTFLGEPIGAAVLAALAFGEIPGAATVIGGSILLIGVILASLEGGSPARGRGGHLTSLRS
jgi:drug/metabolite transporter (DMT)-like permease